MSEAADTRRAIIDKMYAVDHGMVPIYDPEDQDLKAVPKNRTRHFLKMGYHVGTDAQNEMLKHSTGAKVGAFLTAGGNAGSAGLLNLGLAATGNQGAIKGAAQAQSDNPTAALAGTVTGIGASAFAGPLAYGGIGKGVLAAGAAKGGLANLLAVGADAAVQGAPAAFSMGVSDAVTENTLLDHPMSAETIAASGLTDVLWNAGFNALTHGIVRAPGFIRSKTGNLIDHAEHWGLLKAKLVPDVEKAAAQAAEGRVASSSTVYEKSYRAPGERPEPGMGTDHQLGFDAGPDGAFETHTPEEPSIEHRPVHDGMESMPAPHGPEAPPQAAEATAQVLDRAGNEMPLEAGLPTSVADQVAENASVASGRVRIEPELEAVPHVDGIGMKRQKLKAAELAEHAERLRGIKPEDIDPEFVWDGGYSKAQKLEQIRSWTKEGAAQVHEDALPMYDLIQRLEDEASEIQLQHDLSIKQGGSGIPNHKKIIQSKWAEKAAWKEELKKIFPRTWDAESGIWKPGYEDLNSEYRKVARPEAELKGRPDFEDPKIKAWEGDQAKHTLAKQKADAAEANIRLVENHHAELEARDAVVERNRIKTADARAAQKAADKEAALAEKQLSDAAKARARKAIKDEADATKARVRAQVKAEKESAAAARKAEREEAKADAKKLRDHEKRIEAQVKASGKGLKIPRADGGAPKSAKTTTASHVSEGPEGRRTETHTRTERNGQVKERIKVQIHAPKAPKPMKFGGYEQPFSGDIVSKVALGGAMTGLGHITSPIAWGMGAANLAAHIASNRQAIGSAYLRLANGINKLAVPAVAIGSRTIRDQKKNKYTPRTYTLKDYAAMAKTIAHLKGNPSALVQTMQDRYPHLAAERPKLHHAATIAMLRAVDALDAVVPKKPFDPTLVDQDFTPTRAQQIRFMRTWDMLANPNEGLDLSDPDTIRNLENVYPHLTQHNREQLVQMIQEKQVASTGHMARQASTYIGANIRPMNDAAALKRMQETAGPEPMQQPKGSNGAKPGSSAKITNQAAQRDMPTNGLHQLGD